MPVSPQRQEMLAGGSPGDRSKKGLSLLPSSTTEIVDENYQMAMFEDPPTLYCSKT